VSLKFWASYPFFYPDLHRPYGEIVAEVIDIAQAAEELGFEGISFPEHHFFNYICNPSALQYATLVASKTTRLRIQTGVLVLPYYHPLALAEEISLVDHISGGRLDVGVARGANKYEFDRLGVDWSKSRAMYEESLSIMIDAWTKSDVERDGEFWSFPPVTAIPRPHQRPYPRLWVSAQSVNGVTAAGTAGLNMMTSPNLGCFAPHGDLDQVMQWYDEASAASGKPRGEVMVLRRIFIDETEEKALRQLDNVHRHWSYYMSQYKGTPANAQARFQERTENDDIVVSQGAIRPVNLSIERDDVYNTYDDPILTSPDKAITRFKHYESIGVDHVLGLSAFGEPVDEVIHNMEVMAKYVFPAFLEDSTSTPLANA
jgi:alkanesulfonate monooxygenase SsuD/methylene tetrahydromethanopterin reductase-like flavin-dependent oxidoreductase (luciferase family)